MPRSSVASATPTRYSHEERHWSPPAPPPFQYDRGGESPITNSQFFREVLKNLVAFMSSMDATGRLLHFTSQDFRQRFVTDAIRTGLPPHIAQLSAPAPALMALPASTNTPR
ncbi:hypothetical protein [Streptomyces sp. NPDC055794]